METTDISKATIELPFGVEKDELEDLGLYRKSSRDIFDSRSEYDDIGRDFSLDWEHDFKLEYPDSFPTKRLVFYSDYEKRGGLLETVKNFNCLDSCLEILAKRIERKQDTLPPPPPKYISMPEYTDKPKKKAAKKKK